MPKKIIFTILVAALAALLWFVFSNKAAAPATTTGEVKTSESNPSLDYTNASEGLIKIEWPQPNEILEKEFRVSGQARGTWFFEASFPVEILDKDGKVIFQTAAGVERDPESPDGVNWMTEDFVPFRADIDISSGYSGPATLILKNDNPSGEPSRDRSVSLPIIIK